MHCLSTPLIWACDFGYTNIDIVELSNHSAMNINARDTYGRTALTHAGVYNRPHIVKLLLGRSDIDINSRDNYDLTALGHTIQAKKEISPRIPKLLFKETQVPPDVCGVQVKVLVVISTQQLSIKLK